MNKKIIVLILLAAMTMVGVASATPSIDICTEFPIACASSSQLEVYQGVDAGSSLATPQLHALLAGWDTTIATYTISVKDTTAVYPDNPIVYGPYSGNINEDPLKVYFDGWIPDKTGDNVYKIIVSGSQEPNCVVGPNCLEADITVKTVPNVTPELPTSVLLSAGLIGMIGLVKLRRKD